MSGIAELLANLGYAVSGSDAKASDIACAPRHARRPCLHGPRCLAHHRRRRRRHLVRRRGRRTPVVEARARKIPRHPARRNARGTMRLRYGIAIAGAHGKTSTTSMTALVLERGGLDPTAVIGGRLERLRQQRPPRPGPVPWWPRPTRATAHSCKLSPTIAVITNVDEEHLDHYGTFENVLSTFVEFANKVPFYGLVIACADDPRLHAPAAAHDPPHGDLQPGLQRRHPLRTGRHPGSPRLPLRSSRTAPPSTQAPNRHPRRDCACTSRTRNLLNALAAVASLGLELDLPFNRIAAALAEFRRRRTPLPDPGRDGTM